MQINGSSSSMMYQYYAEMAQQRRMQGAAPTEDAEVQEVAAANSYVAIAQQVDLRQEQQSQEVAPSMEVGDRASQSNGAPEYAQPGGRSSNAGELLRLLGANTQGTSAASASGGESSSRNSFMNEVLKSFSDSGRYEQSMGSNANSFNVYMKDLLHSTYGV